MTAVLPLDKFATELTPASGRAQIAYLKDIGAKVADARPVMVPLDRIQILEGFNVRVTGTAKYQAGIRALADSIKADGFYPDKPLTGYLASEGDDSVIYVTDGHRRLAAAQMVATEIAEGEASPVTALPVILKPATTSMEDLTVALAKTGEPLTPYELAIVCKRLRSFQLEPAQIAIRLQITPRYVFDLDLLASVPSRIRTLVIEDRISATLVIQEMRADRKNGPARIVEKANELAKIGKTRITPKDLGRKKNAKSSDDGTEPAEPATGDGTDPAEPATGDGTEPAAETNGHTDNRQPVKMESVWSAAAGETRPLSDLPKWLLDLDGGTWYSLLGDEPDSVTITRGIKAKLSATIQPYVPSAEELAEQSGL